MIIDSGSPEYDEVDEGDEDHVESGDQDVEESYGVVDWQVYVDAGLEEVGPVFFRLDSIGAVIMNILVFLHSTPPASKSPAPIMDLGAQVQL